MIFEELSVNQRAENKTGTYQLAKHALVDCQDAIPIRQPTRLHLSVTPLTSPFQRTDEGSNAGLDSRS